MIDLAHSLSVLLYFRIKVEWMWERPHHAPKKSTKKELPFARQLPFVPANQISVFWFFLCPLTTRANALIRHCSNCTTATTLYHIVLKVFPSPNFTRYRFRHQSYRLLGCPTDTASVEAMVLSCRLWHLTKHAGRYQINCMLQPTIRKSSSLITYVNRCSYFR